jgi:hypothetical protein
LTPDSEPRQRQALTSDRVTNTLGVLLVRIVDYRLRTVRSYSPGIHQSPSPSSRRRAEIGRLRFVCPALENRDTMEIFRGVSLKYFLLGALMLRHLYCFLSGNQNLHATFDDPRPPRQCRHGAQSDTDLVSVPGERRCRGGRLFAFPRTADQVIRDRPSTGLSGRTTGFMCCWVIKTGTGFRSIERSRDILSHLGCHATCGSPTTWRTIS